MSNKILFQRQPLLSLSKKYILAVFGLLFVLAIIVKFWPRGDDMTQNIAPSWRGIIPGETTKQEVIQIMGQPDDIVKCTIWLDRWFTDLTRCFKGHLIYKYKEQHDNLSAIHEIHFQSEKVWFIVEDVIPNSDDAQTSIEKFVELYGLPERATWSKLAPHFNAVLFCQHGVIVHASGRFGKVFYFRPMSFNKCLREFSNEVATKNPFPDSDVINVEDPWGFNER
jgi:hypothetical protein